MVNIAYWLHYVMHVQAFCGDCGMCKSNKTNLCGKVRAWTGKGIMAADDQPRFTHKESGKKIYHFVRGHLKQIACAWSFYSGQAFKKVPTQKHPRSRLRATLYCTHLDCNSTQLCLKAFVYRSGTLINLHLTIRIQVLWSSFDHAMYSSLASP